AVGVVARGAEDADAGRRQVHAGAAVVGERRQVVIRVGGGDRDDVRQVITGGIEGVLVVVLADAEEVAVAGGRHIDVPRVAGVAWLLSSIGSPSRLAKS